MRKDVGFIIASGWSEQVWLSSCTVAMRMAVVVVI